MSWKNRIIVSIVVGVATWLSALYQSKIDTVFLPPVWAIITIGSLVVVGLFAQKIVENQIKKRLP